jgi:alcohol dehydrogenase class IV
MDTFEYIGAGHRVLFGSGTVEQLPSMLQKINATVILILSTPEQASSAETVRRIIGDAAVSIFSQATMHTPTHITEKAVLVARQKSVNGIISIGGGSTVGLGKAISIRTGLPHLCIPTTYAGSEMTPILGETEHGQKVTRRDMRILPGAVLYDVELFKSLPVGLTVYSGINAIAHAGQLTYSRRMPPPNFANTE